MAKPWSTLVCRNHPFRFVCKPLGRRQGAIPLHGDRVNCSLPCAWHEPNPALSCLGIRRDRCCRSPGQGNHAPYKFRRDKLFFWVLIKPNVRRDGNHCCPPQPASQLCSIELWRRSKKKTNTPLPNWLLILFVYFILCVCVCLHVHVCLVAKEAKRGHWVPWKWSYRQLWLSLWCWEPSSGPRQER